MQFEAGETIEADEVAVSIAVDEFIDFMDVMSEEHGEGVTLLAFLSLHRKLEQELGFVIEEPGTRAN